MHINCIGEKLNFYSVLTVIDALLTNAFHATYAPIPARTKTPNRFILHYLVISSQPVKHRPPKPCNAYKLHWEKVNFPLRIDGHRRVIDQCLSHHICTNTSTYQNNQPLYITLLSYLWPTRQTSAPNHAMHINCIGKK